ncbi:MAG TPA: arsenite efflux transporter metallochaperone ArsD [Gemmatimonadales bacterium]
MTRIQVYDPPLCCSTGVCGPEVDDRLIAFAADAAWAARRGMELERFNLAHDPMAFADQPLVREALEQSGPEVLPLVLVDGDIALSGRYPSRAELAQWAGVSLPPSRPLPLAGT